MTRPVKTQRDDGDPAPNGDVRGPKRRTAVAVPVDEGDRQSTTSVTAAVAQPLGRVDPGDERERTLRAAAELARVGTWTWEIGSDVLSWSDYGHQIFGTDPAGPSATYQTYVDMLHPDDRERVLSVIRSAMATGERYEVDHRIVRPDGEIAEIRGTGQAELDAQGRAFRLIGGLQDVTEMRRQARSLQESRDLFAGVLNAATELSVIALDRDGLITVFNTGAERMLGYSAEEMIGTSPERLHDADEIRARATELGMRPDFDVFLAQPATGVPETRRWTYITRDGQRLMASLTVSAMHDAAGNVTGFIKVGTDVTEEQRARAALEDSESRFRTLFQHAPNGMMLLGVGAANRGRFLQVNPAMCRLTGYSEDKLLSMGMGELVPTADRDGYEERLDAFQLDPVLAAPVERHWIHSNGSDLWVQLNLSPGEGGSEDAYVVGQVEDITERKRTEDILRHQALHDGLTGLPNRILLMDRIEHALASSKRTNSRVGVEYIDLDGFKAVNDSAGHAMGDRALVHAAHQISGVLRPGDTVSRVGGDEFVVVCENLTSVADATVIADRILAAVRVPFSAGGVDFSLSGSIGVVLSLPDSSPERLLQDADQAMYVAKGAGKGQVQVGAVDDPARLAQSAQAIRLMRVSAELDRALQRDELIMFGQPVMDLSSGRVVSVETLVRWMHPTEGMLAPIEFLDVAEAGNLMLPIGRRVLRESCRMAASWVDQCGAAAPSVHVNVSGRQLEAGNLHEEVAQALSDFDLDPTRLVLELTETHMPLIADSLKTDLEALRKRGVRLAIDDLGTGYSSLTRITELPVDILKIDLTFVAGMETDPSCDAVVRGVIAIGDALGMDVIAEGLETSSQRQQLREYGCTLAQGYLYSRPLPEQALNSHLVQSVRAS